MDALRLVTLIALVLGVGAAGARTAWAAHKHGIASGKTASWFLYCLGRRWPWVVWVHGALYGASVLTFREFVLSIVAFAAGHWWGAMSDHPDTTGATQQ